MFWAQPNRFYKNKNKHDKTDRARNIILKEAIE